MCELVMFLLSCFFIFFFFFNDPAATEIYTLSLHDALPISLLMASSVRLKPLNCSRLPCVYAQETLTFSGRSEERFSRNAETDLVCRLLLEKKKQTRTTRSHQLQRRDEGRRLVEVLD